MGKLYDTKLKIEEVIKKLNLNEFETKGKIGLKSGILLATIRPDTEDNEEKVEKLKKAAKEILGINI